MNSMSENREHVYHKIIALINKQLPPEQAKELSVFARQYYANVPIDDLAERPVANLYGALLSHWELICQRRRNEYKIRVYNPHFEQHGWQSSHTVIEVATDDMPFLVDSLRMEINRQGYRIHFMIHLGSVRIRRDKDFHVLNILPLEEETKDDLTFEAPIYIEIDRQSDPTALDRLQAGLGRVLEDVRAVVTDWDLMRQRMQEYIAELKNNPPDYDPKMLRESEAFLKFLNDDHFTYLGCRDYIIVGEGDEQALCIVRGTGLGVLRHEEKSQAVRLISTLPPAALELAYMQQVLVISKTNTKATVHRPVYTDYIGLKRFNEQGRLIGERRFIGLYTSTVYNSHPKDIPLLRHKIATVLENTKLPAKGHSGKELMDILATLPRDDLFQANIEELTDLALGILHIQNRQQIRLFVRQDAYRRFVSCLVYVPKEQYNTELSLTIQDILLNAFQGLEITSFPLFSESVLARVHFLIRTDPNKDIKYDVKQIESHLIDATRSWKDELREDLIDYYGEENGIALWNKYERAFPVGYRDDFMPRIAVYDIEHIEKLSDTNPLEMNLYQTVGEPRGHFRFKLFRIKNPIILSDVLPMLENMGLRVIDERPHEIILKDGNSVWVDDFGVVYPEEEEINVDDVKERFQDAFRQVWFCQAENDGFNRLVLGAKLTWREAVLLRAYTKYLRQIGFTFSQAYIENTLAKNTLIAKQLLEIFNLQFDLTLQENSAQEIAAVLKQLYLSLDAVANLDEDRILRRLLEVIKATTRTNYFQKTVDGHEKSYISFKLNPSRISELPLPRPTYEIFVYSPRVEAVHLRAGKVARGGIRWSDRREDFRTEILGLMKAQQVKNAVIVPTGAKGGFVVKNLPPEGSRESIMEEVVSCYETFMRGLLDITDNLYLGNVISPSATVCYDGDDPYLVVAADKGTATFSDIANNIAKEYGFWLGDAFASGGITGYDHKKMGITARGAWESVKRHFTALGINPDEKDFTVIGIGDMSGDVFGNGMLLSRHIKLVGAFNHMHIFLDPEPDPETSFLERERLFKLPRSTWEDYDPKIISPGGGVFRRTLKAIPLSPQVKKLLGVEQDSIEPNALIRLLLTAEVDLLWNGGIGTYVKATQERHFDVGDRANDAVRVNAIELKCRSVAEGGNLGFTQLARVEYSINEGLIYTDFIDNSAGVDCSDHEVNCKILLNGIVESGDMTFKQRNLLLADMTAEVAELCLRDNYSQTHAISLMTSQSAADIELYRTYINELDRLNKLDRTLEFLPDDETLLNRKTNEKGMTSPEIAILLAYTKILVKNELLASAVLTDPYLQQAIELAFPEPLRVKFREQMEEHSLRREIIVTQVSNRMINDMGVLFVYRMQNETGADLIMIVRAYTIASQIFALHEMFKLIDSLDYQISLDLRYQMTGQIVRLVRRAARWFLRNHKERLISVADTITLFRQGILELTEDLPQLLSGSEYEEWDKVLQHYNESAIPEQITTRLAAMKCQYDMLDIIAAAKENNLDLKEVASIYFSIGETLDFAWLREKITLQPVGTNWDAMARSALRDDLDAQQHNLTIAVIRTTSKSADVPLRVDEWVKKHQTFIDRWRQLLTELRNHPSPEIIMYSVVIRELVSLVLQQKSEYRRLKAKVKA